MRNKNGWTDVVYCPEDECEHEINVAFYPGSKGSTYGPPEDSYPPEGPDIDIEYDECPGCGRKFTERDIDRWIENLDEAYRDRADRW